MTDDLSTTELQQLAAALPAYRFGAVVGRGAFAVVYAARHVQLDRDVAVKRLSPALLQDPAARERFASEARLLASLDHPHIVRVHDYVEADGVCALVMERLHGGTLADRIALAPLDRARSCAVALAALYGLEHAHRKGVLHRDVKPENLLFGERDLVKVADFGIAKLIGGQDPRLTMTATLGTPAFMAPEQLSRTVGPLSTATDVWALGAVLYELLAGEPPFVATPSVGDTILQRINEPARPISAIAPDVPDELAAVVMTALEREPSDRYPTAAAFAAALEPVAEEAAYPGGLARVGIPIHRVEAPPDGPAAPRLVEPSAAAAVRSGGRRPAGGRGRRRGLLAGAALAVVGAVAAVAVALGGGGGDDAAAAELPPAPPAWPKAMLVGYNDQVSGSAGVAKHVVEGGSAADFFAGDAATRKDWSHERGHAPARFVRATHALGLMPYLVYIQLTEIGLNGESAQATQLRRTLVNPRLMEIYWRNVRAFLKSVGSTGLPAAISVKDDNAWAYLEQELTTTGHAPETVQARVALSGLPELKGMRTNLLGVARGWGRLRDRYAPKAMLGWSIVDWATTTDISRDSPDRTAAEAAGRALGQFYLQLAPNQFDFIALNTGLGNELEEGESHNPRILYSAAERERFVDLTRELVRVADLPVVVEAVPTGNTASRAITDKPFHWHDRWVQWLLGDDRFTGLRRLRGAGVIGIHFGINGGESETCPCDAAKDGVTNGGSSGSPSISADDDGGYLLGRLAALQRSGGLAAK